MKKSGIYCIVSLLLLHVVCDAQRPSRWITIFDGKSTDQLRGYNMTGFPDQAWKVEDNELVTQTGVPNIDLVTKESYKNFEMEFEWKVAKAANSGVFFHIKENAVHQSGNGNSPNWLDNFEMQILDDIDFNDKEPKRSAGSNYDLIAPQNKKLKPVGEYNTAKLVVNKNHVENWINGVKVVEYEMGSDELNKLIAGSKFKNNPIFGKSEDGLIMFQHHGQQVWFRNIKIRRL
jgi:hypothetical protein